jgi:hypothetical protein
LAIETFQNNFILEFYLNFILLLDEMLPVKKKANSLLEKRRDIQLTAISFLFLSLFLFSNPLFYVFFCWQASYQPNLFVQNFAQKGKTIWATIARKGFF